MIRSDLTGSNYIAGVPSRAGHSTFTNYNPRTREGSGVEYYNASPAEIAEAVEAAAAAFEVTRHYPPQRLAAFLEEVALQIEKLGDHLLEVTDWETGLGLPRLSNERGRTTGQLRKFAALLREGSYVEAIIDHAQPERQPSPRPDIRRMLVPLGVVAVFSASNFPYAFATAGGDTASAWAAGCPVVLKGHPAHPATSERFALAIQAAIERQGFPPGFFSLLQGADVAVGQQLVEHPLVEAVGFTGSLRAGRAIYNLAAAREKPIPVYAEMGSVNPVLLLPGALTDRWQDIAEGLVNSATLGSGQFCTNPGLVLLVDSPEARALIEQVQAMMAAREPDVLLYEKIQDGLAQAVAQTAAKSSVSTLTGGHIVEGEGYCYANTVLQSSAAALRDDPDLQQEHFGAVTLFVLADSVADLAATLPHLHGSLTATLHAEAADMEIAAKLLPILREKAGRILWNGFPTGVEVVYAMQHGGPYPATTAPGTTSVGMTAIKRFMRPVAYQNFPPALLPPALQEDNPLGIWRIVDDEWQK